MLRLMAPNIRAALSRAAGARQRSFECRDGSELQRFWLKMEAKWLHLADSYTEVERVATFLESVKGAAIRGMSEGYQTNALPTTIPPSSPGITMRRAMIEEHLLQAEEAVLLGAKHIERQKEIIAELEQRGQESTAARGLLKTFLALQNEHLAHRDRLRLELGLEHERR